MSVFRFRAHRAATCAFALLAGALLLAGCDSDGPETDSGAFFRVQVTGAEGAPVEGLRVGVRPCFAGSCDPSEVFSIAAGTTMAAGTTAESNAQPVQLDFFEAEVNDGDVLLSWETTSEESNEGFHIERQSGNESRFSRIGFAEAGGPNVRGRAYQFRDASPSPGMYVYQLVQQDVDGSTTTFEEDRATVAVSVDGLYARRGPYPHPFQSRTTLGLTVQESQLITIEVQELDGERVATLFDGAFDAVQTRGVQYTPGDDTPDGLYQIVTEGETFADTAYAAVTRAVDAVPRRLGTTGTDGTFATDERIPFPALFDPPMLERRTPAGSQTGTFAVTNLVEIALTDPDTGAQQTYERIVRAGERNAFSLNWTR